MTPDLSPDTVQAALPVPSIDEALKALEQYRALISASNTGAWEYHIQSDTLECNDIYFELLGHKLDIVTASRGNGLQQLWFDFLHPDDAVATIKGFYNYMENPVGMYESIFRMQHADGRWVWICSRGKFIEYANTNYGKSMIGTLVDITAQKQVEEDTRRDKLLLRTLIDNLPDTVYVKDAEGRKVIANIADVWMIGANSEAEIIGKNDLEMFQTEEGARGYKDDMEVIRTGNSMINKEERFFDREGNQVWLLTSKIAVKDEKGDVINIIGIGHNITHRKKTDDEMREMNRQLQQQSADLKALNEQILKQKEQELEKAIAQGKFEIASEVLHDIGNALVGFGSHLNRIKRVIDKSSPDGIRNLSLFLKSQQEVIGSAIGPEKAKALVSITEAFVNTQDGNQKEINTAITDLLNIITHIQEILSIQRQLVRSHDGVHERKPVNLVNLIEDSRSMLFASFEKRGVDVKTDIKPGKYIIKGDHTKLMQVILNVLKNSLEAMPLELDVNKIRIEMDADDEQIIMKFTDNGKGFDQETASHFFQRGFTTKVTGTGLGLTSCRSIIESHAGTFDLTSEGPGKGAQTTITFKI